MAICPRPYSFPIPGPEHKLNASLLNPMLILPPWASLQSGCWVSPCQKQGFWQLWEMLSLNSIIFGFLRITQWFTIFLEETLKDFLAQFPFFSSWLQPLSSRLSIVFPAPVTQPSLLEACNCVSSPSCSRAGTRPKVINLSELISSVCTLSLTPRAVILCSLTAWELAHTRVRAPIQQNQKLLCNALPHPYPEKPSFLLPTLSPLLCSLTVPDFT